MSTYWWLGRWAYLKFILRELSSAFIAYFVFLTLAEIHAIRQGPLTYVQFNTWLLTPWVMVLNVITFFFVVFHSVTWFSLAPKAMDVRFRGRVVPPHQVVLGNLAAWVVVSLIVALVVLWR